MTSSYTPSVPLEHDSSALLNCPPLIPSSFRPLLISTSSSYNFAIHPRTSPPPCTNSRYIPLPRPSAPSLALSKRHSQYCYIATPCSSSKMISSISQPSSPRRVSEPITRPPSRSERLLRDTLRKANEQSRMSSPSRSRPDCKSSTDHSEEAKHFGPIGNFPGLANSECECDEDMRMRPQPRRTSSSLASFDFLMQSNSGQLYGTSKPVAVRRHNSSSSRNPPAVANGAVANGSSSSTTDGQYLHSRPRGKAHIPYGSPSSPSPLPLFARTQTAPTTSSTPASKSVPSTAPSSGANSLTHSPKLNSSSDLTSSSSFSTQDLDESHTHTVNASSRLKPAGSSPAVGKLRGQGSRHDEYITPETHHHITDTATNSRSTYNSSTDSSPRSSSSRLSPHNLHIHPDGERLQDIKQQTPMRPDLRRPATTSGVNFQGRIHSLSVDSSPVQQHRVAIHKHGERSVTYSPHEAVLKARLEDVLLRASAEDTQNVPVRAHGRSKSYSVAAGQMKPWGIGVHDDYFNQPEYQLVHGSDRQPLTPASLSPRSYQSYENDSEPVTPSSTPPMHGALHTPPSLSFDAALALENCKRMDGYVSFASVEGLGAPADFDLEARDDGHDAENAVEAGKRWGRWWRAWTIGGTIPEERGRSTSI